MSNENLVVIGIIIGAVGSLGYIFDTLRGKTKPDRVTFFLWSIIPLIAFSAEIKQSVGIQSLMTLSVAIFPFAIFLASFVNKKARWRLTHFDILCGVLSIIGIILWQIFNNGNIAIAFSILADATAALPTIVKSYAYPTTESAWPRIAGAINALCTLVTITTWDFAHFGFPLYILLLNAIIYINIKHK